MDGWNVRMKWKVNASRHTFNFILVKITSWRFCATIFFSDFSFFSFASFSDRWISTNWTREREREVLEIQSNRMIAQQMLFTFWPVFSYTIQSTSTIWNWQNLCAASESGSDSDGERWRRETGANKQSWKWIVSIRQPDVYALMCA